MGNPHAVIPLEDIQDIPLSEWGPIIERHKFFPANTNVHFISIESRSHIKVKVWERGCGPTLACGTGACASFVTSRILKYVDSIICRGFRIHLI